MGTYDHTAFQVSNMDAAIEFYVTKLGFTFEFRSVNHEEREECAFLSLGDLRLELLQDLKIADYPKPEPQPPYCPHLAIQTDDMDQAVARLKQNGVPILRGPLKIEGAETWVYFLDPDHNVLEYIQWFKKE